MLALVLNPFEIGGAPAAPWSAPIPSETQPSKPTQSVKPPGTASNTPPAAPSGQSNATAASELDRKACSSTDVDASLSACTRLIEALPRTDSWLADAYYFRARVRDGKKQNELALKDLTDSIAVNPKASGSFNYRGVIHVNMGNQDLAIADYSAAARIAPNWATPVANLAEVYRKKGDLDVAMTKINEAYRLGPTDPWTLNVKTRISFDLKQWAVAATDATSWIAAAPTASEAYYLRGASKEELKDAVGAIADLAEAERLGYKTAAVFNYRGSAYEQLGNIDQAQLAYAASLRIHGQGVFPLNRRAEIAYSKRLMSDVESNIAAVLAIDPKNFNALALRVRMASDSGNFSQAVAEADRILESKPNDTYIVYLRARSLLNAEIAIIEPCKKYGQVTADRSRWIIGVAQDVKCREGPDIAGGIRALDRALALNQAKPILRPESLVDIYATRGNGYFLIGSRQQAEKDWRSGLAINPNNALIRQFMQQAGFRF